MIKSPSILGYNVSDVTVECSASNGLPSLVIVGLANKAVEESKERIRSAITASGYKFPKKKIVVNLAPADIPKNSSSIDLAIALAILQSDKQINLLKDSDYICIGELGLDGSIKPAKGIIGLLKNIYEEKTNDFIIYVPLGNVKQAKNIEGSHKIYPVESLREVVEHINGNKNLATIETIDLHTDNESSRDNYIDFSEIKGQDNAKRALLIAAAGAHNILLTGPPGTGKSMLAKAFSNILPDLSIEQSLETTHIHSLVGLELKDIITRPPIRSPHHTSSNVALVGGGHTLKPGEISLSHNGVLFLDELPEFQKQAIESLRQPMEDNIVSISRAQSSTTYPANFILISTSNPCPCGYYNSTKQCNCTAQEISRYQKKLSGPILDRIDIHIDVNNVDHVSLLSDVNKKETPSLRKSVLRARTMQLNRSSSLNSKLNNKDTKKFSKLDDEAKTFLDMAASKLDISARSYMKTVKVARTIADIENSPHITKQHIAEALQYRPKLINL